jgi:hypothetical protein
MKECKNCKYCEELPFADEFICTNPNSEFAECPCEPNDTCDEWEED